MKRAGLHQAADDEEAPKSRNAATGPPRGWSVFNIFSAAALVGCLLLYVYIAFGLGAERDPRDVAAGIAWPPNEGVGEGETLTEREAARVCWLLGGKTALSQLVPKLVARVDAFVLGGGERFLWAWRASSCNGLGSGNDSPWSASNGRRLGTAIGRELARLRSFGVLAKGGVAIDIGAHVGDSTLPTALLANRTIAFDPNPEVFKVLQANALLNPDLKIDAHNAGIAGKDGTLEFQYGGLCNGGVAGYGTGGQSHTFRVVNLERFLTRTYGADIIPSIRFIKTDVEGFDHQLVRDMLPLITAICQAAGCPILQVEWANWFQDKSDPQGVTEGSKKLFDAIALLPGKWRIFCTGQCIGKDPSAGESCVGERAELTGLAPTSGRHCADLILTATGD